MTLEKTSRNKIFFFIPRDHQWIQEVKSATHKDSTITPSTQDPHQKTLMTYTFPFKPLRDQISYKQNEAYLMEARDRLCAHYRLNKSDLIKKEDYNLRKPDGLLEIHP